jgi:hypothetical protein
MLQKNPQERHFKEVKELYLESWQNEWNTAAKGGTTKSFYPNIELRLTLKISPTPNFTTIVTGHGKINSYLHRFKIIENPMCPCNREDQTVDHIIYRCVLHEQERNRLKSDINSSEKWPVSKNILATKYYKHFKFFTDSIVFNKE